jgi:hypothetical protein
MWPLRGGDDQRAVGFAAGGPPPPGHHGEKGGALLPRVRGPFGGGRRCWQLDGVQPHIPLVQGVIQAQRGGAHFSDRGASGGRAAGDAAGGRGSLWFTSQLNLSALKLSLRPYAGSEAAPVIGPRGGSDGCD